MHVKTTHRHVELGMASLHHGAFILKLLATKNKALLIRWHALHILDLLLDIIDGVAVLQLELDHLLESIVTKSAYCHANAGPSGAPSLSGCFSLPGFTRP